MPACCAQSWATTNKKPRITGAFVKRLKGLEPSTFCMASRRSSQLSYSRAGAQYSLARTAPREAGGFWHSGLAWADRSGNYLQNPTNRGKLSEVR